MNQSGRALGEAGEFAGEAGGGLLEERLPGGYVVGEAGDGLELGGFKGGAGDLCFGGELGWVEQAAAGDGDLLGEDEAELGGEAVLAADPGVVGGGAEVEDGVAADGRSGLAGDEGEERLPFEGGEVGVFYRVRDGVEERHVQVLVYLHMGWGGRWIGCWGFPSLNRGSEFKGGAPDFGAHKPFV